MCFYFYLDYSSQKDDFQMLFPCAYPEHYVNHNKNDQFLN